ncbi:DUF421 domain-containing protein [Paenibacillus sp. GCM10023252]|uniref:DUF421 domain-containing protein n=1 Tax=Paenibacillus sp. GCM10023252 TaxID=3252649 RepID=UPI0036221E9B
MDFWVLLLRTIMIYFIVLVIMRSMGKREIGKMSVFDLVISFMIAEIAVIVIEDTDRTMIEGIIPMVTLLGIQLLISFITLRSRSLRQLFDGNPSIIIAKGKLNPDTMRKQRYTLDDLMLQLRENQVYSVADVEFAILETSGKLSILPKEKSAPDNQPKPSPQTKKEPIIPSHYRYEILPIPLIMDGKVQDKNLEKIEKTRFWLKNVLQEEGVQDIKDVFLCTIDHKDKIYVDSSKKRKPRM